MLSKLRRFCLKGLGCSKTWFSRNIHQMLIHKILFGWKKLSEIEDIAPDSWKFLKKLDFPLISHCNLHRRFGSNQGFSKNFQLSGAISSSSDNIFNPNKILDPSIWCILLETLVFEHPKPFIQKPLTKQSLYPPPSSLTQFLKIPSSIMLPAIRIHNFRTIPERPHDAFNHKQMRTESDED